jgi:hypothetical protein
MKGEKIFQLSVVEPHMRLSDKLVMSGIAGRGIEAWFYSG